MLKIVVIISTLKLKTMKKIVLIGALVIGAISAQGQTLGFLLEGQAKAMQSATMLLNKNISDKGAEQDYALGMGTTFGAGLNAYFGNIGLGIEINGGKHNGNYAGTIFGQSYTSQVTLKQLQIPILLKLKGENGGYFEIGPQINRISSARYTRNGLLSTAVDVKSNYVNYTSVVMGFGANIRLVKSIPLGLLIGMRLQYGFKDCQGVDALGNSLSNTLYYPTPANTMAVAAGLQLGLTYKFN